MNLNPAVADRIGLSGVGAEDLGVLMQPSAIANLFKLGKDIGAIDQGRWETIQSSKHGSVEQRECVEEVSSGVLQRLSENIEVSVREALPAWFDRKDSTFEEYCDWAANSGWEFPVVFGPEVFESQTGLRIGDECGLRVMECLVGKIEGPAGDVLCAFVEYLTEESLKRSGHCILKERLMMHGVFADGISTEALDELKGISGERLLGWFGDNVPEGLEELSGYSDDQDDVLSLVYEVKEVLVATHAMDTRVKNVVGDRKGAELLEKLLDDADRYLEAELKEFVLNACSAMRGLSTRERIDELPLPHFERFPGEYAVVDMGLELGEREQQMYQEINEYAHGGEDHGWIPLDGPKDKVVDLLVRITIAERLLLGLATLVE
ncbi:MAG: hypothetical protein GKR90_25535 [Pseudomonadales bacterium]|nr:hypothetical protein [Pseudomonadales bacterium]